MNPYIVFHHGAFQSISNPCSRPLRQALITLALMPLLVACAVTVSPPGPIQATPPVPAQAEPRADDHASTATTEPPTASPPHVQVAARHAAWTAAAQAAYDQGDAATARDLSRKVLIENLHHPRAQELLQRIEQSDQAGAVMGRHVLAEAYRRPITIEFKDAPLKTVFEVISRTSGINFLFDREVRTDQKTSIYLRQSTIEAAIGLTLLTNRLDQWVLDHNTILIYPATPSKQREYQPLTVRVFYLAHAQAKVVASTLKTILKTRDLVTDDALNMLIMRDRPEAIRLAERLVAAHDIPEPEVMLEVEILEINRKRLRELGIRWPEQLTLTPLSSSGGDLTLSDLREIVGNGRGSLVGAGIGATSINARRLDSDGDILANPRIRVRNRQKASVLIGDRVPNITSTSTATGFVAESISYVDVGLKLEVEPSVQLDGDVALTLALEVSNIVDQIRTQGGSIAYRIGTRSAQTSLRLRDGENQVLAGLISREERQSASRVPGLGDLPLVGRLFGSRLDDDIETEIVLSLTPRVLRHMRPPGAAGLEFMSGTDSSLGIHAAGLAGNSGSTGSVAPVRPGGSKASGELNTPSRSDSDNVTEPLARGIDADAGVESQAPRGNTVDIGSTRSTTSAGSAPTTSSVHLEWQGPSRADRTQQITLRLDLRSSDSLVSVPVVLGFDPQALEIVTVTEGDVLREGGTPTSFMHRVDPRGRILISSTRSGATPSPVAGSILEVTARVLATAPGDTSISVLSATPITPAGPGTSPQLPLTHLLTVQP